MSEAELGAFPKRPTGALASLDMPRYTMDCAEYTANAARASYICLGQILAELQRANKLLEVATHDREGS